MPARRSLKEDGVGCYCSGFKVRQTVKWYTDECEWATWKDKGLSALILPLLRASVPYRFGHLKNLNKKATHEKIFRINTPVSYINFCWPKCSGKGIFSHRLMTQGMLAPNSLWKRLSAHCCWETRAEAASVWGPNEILDLELPWQEGKRVSGKNGLWIRLEQCSWRGLRVNQHSIPEKIIIK